MRTEYEFKSAFNERYSLLSRRILRMLSENSRITTSEMAEQLGISRQAVSKRIDKLENDLGINYTIEPNEDLLGLSNPHLIFVKFKTEPDYEKIRELFMSSCIPQFAAIVKGRYDMIIYANATSRDEYVHWDKSTQMLLSEYKVLWQPSEVAHRQLGFFPLRTELIEKLNLPPKEKEMIKLLNGNSRASFQKISKATGMHFNTTAYNFKKLLKHGYINRFTLTIQPVKGLTIMSIFGKYIISGNFENDAVIERRALMSDDEYSLIGRYILSAQLVGSFDWFSIGVFDDLQTAYRNGVAYYKMAMKRQNVRAEHGTIEEVLLGRLPLRSWDTNKHYNVLRWIPTSKR